MPTTYTPDTDNNPASITLPSDLDPFVAEAFNAAFRALADKIKYTQETSALIASRNNFSRGQIIEPPHEDEPVIGTEHIPGEDDDDNIWKMIFDFRITSIQSVRLYVGSNSAAGRVAIVQGAHWLIPDQKWTLDNEAADAVALIWRQANLSWLFVPAGSEDWENWPTTKPTANGHLISTGEFRYAQSRQTIRTVPVTSACGAVSFSGTDGSVSPTTLDDHSYIRFPLYLPVGSVLQKVYVLHFVNNEASETFRVTRRRPTWDPFDPEVPTEDELVEAVSGSAVGTHLTTLNVGGATVDRHDELCLLWEPSALLLNNVHAITMEFMAVGPSQ